MNNKSIFLLPLLLLAFLAALPASTVASPEEPPPEEISLLINGDEHSLSPAPVIREGRMMVPLRSFSEEVGAKVEWYDQTRVALAYLENSEAGETEQGFQPQSIAEEKSFDTQAIIIDGRIYVSLRSASEHFGYDIDWDEEMRTVSIYKNAEKDDIAGFLGVSADKAEIVKEEEEEDNAPQATGNFIWPVKGGGQVTSPYGWRNGRFHAGVDIGASTGTPILAADNGTVIFEGWEGGYGRSIVIKHDRYYTRYAHNSVNLVSTGETVEKGQIIAEIGATGRATGPHLHFEIRIGGKYGTTENPMIHISW